MTTRQQKIEAIREHSKHLMELAISYRDAASVVERLPDKVVDTMYLVSITNNQVHEEIAVEIEGK